MKRALFIGSGAIVLLVITLVATAVIFPDGRDAARSAAADIADTTGCTLTGIVVLQAQAVPTASKVPCVLGTLVGWNAGTQQVENGSAKFSYATTSSEGAKWTIELHPSCTPAPNATIAAFDSPGVVRRRTDRIENDIAEHDEWYTFAGGCAFYQVTIPDRFDEQKLFDELETAFRLVDRSAIDRSVRARSGGAFGLDPS